MKKYISFILVLSVCLALLSGCNNKKSNTETSPKEISFVGTDEEMFTDRDFEIDYDEKNAVKIMLNGNSVTATDSSVEINGTTVTITKDATHIISGDLTDGVIIVDAPQTVKLQLVLKEANINSSTSAPLYIKEADKVFVTLVGDNALSSGDTFTQTDNNNIDGTVFSKQDLTINGQGSLSVTSPAGHGIVCKDDLVLIGGSYNITSASHGIQANDSVRIKDIELSADCGKDGIHSENTDDAEKGFVYISSGNLKIESEGDGISSGSYMKINSGNIEVLAGGGYENGTKKASENFGAFGGGGGMHAEKPNGGMRPSDKKPPNMSPTAITETEDSSQSMKGIKSGKNMEIYDGTFNINSADDGIHSNASVTISGGNLNIASGDDGIHSEESLIIKEGIINISNSYEGLEALHIKVKGGDISVTATDDGINAAGGVDNSGAGGRDNMFGGGGMSANSDGSIIISGGKVKINASGDGIDANGTLEITGGYTTVTGPTQGDTATLDYDVNGVITGGTFIGTGASNMAQSFSSSKQGVIAISVGEQAANTEIILKNSNCKEILKHTPDLSFQIVILSSPDIVAGEKYTVFIGENSGEFEAN